MISVKGFRRKHDLPSPSGDLKFPKGKVKEVLPVPKSSCDFITYRPPTTKEYVEEFDKLNGFKPVDYTCFNQKEVGL